MSAITGSDGTSVGYIQAIRNRALAAKAAAEAEGDDEAEAAETVADSAELSAFKTEFAKTLSSLAGQPHLAMSTVAFDISDDAYARMLDDPSYKTKVTEYVKSTLNSSYSNPPSKAVFTIDKNGENADVSYGALGAMDRSLNVLASMSTPNLRMGLTYYKNQNMSAMLGLLGNGSASAYGSASGASAGLSAVDWLG